MKKLLSLILSATMVATLCVPVYAVDLNEAYSLEEASVTLQGYGVDAPNLQLLEASEDSFTVSHVLSNGQTSYITAKEDNGGMIFQIKEGNLENEILITEDNRLYLDGVEIKIEQTAILEENTITPARRSFQYNTEKCPYGQPWEYTDSAGTQTHNNIPLEKKISQLAVDALAFIIGQFASGWTLGITMFIAEHIIAEIGESDPDTDALSCRVRTYYHQDGRVIGGTAYMKYLTTWYSDLNCTGSSTSTATYRVIEYNT